MKAYYLLDAGERIETGDEIFDFGTYEWLPASKALVGLGRSPTKTAMVRRLMPDPPVPEWERAWRHQYQDTCKNYYPDRCLPWTINDARLCFYNGYEAGAADGARDAAILKAKEQK